MGTSTKKILFQGKTEKFDLFLSLQGLLVNTVVVAQEHYEEVASRFNASDAVPEFTHKHDCEEEGEATTCITFPYGNRPCLKEIEDVCNKKTRYQIYVPVNIDSTYYVDARSAEEAYKLFLNGDAESNGYENETALTISKAHPIVVQNRETGEDTTFSGESTMMKTVDKALTIFKDDATNVGVRTTVQSFIEIIKPTLKELITKEFGIKFAKYLEGKIGEGIISVVAGFVVMTPGLVFNLDDEKAGALAEMFATEFRRHGMTQIVAPLAVKLIGPVRDAMQKAMAGNIKVEELGVSVETPRATEEREEVAPVAKKNGHQARA